MAFLRARRETLLTTWPVLAEVCHLVPPSTGAGLLRWIAAGGATVWHVQDAQASAMAELMERYADLPMDLADASLVWLCRHTGTSRVATIDRTDFAIYRGQRDRVLRNVFFGPDE